MKPIGLKQGYRTPFVKTGKEFSRIHAVALSALLIDRMLEKGTFSEKWIQHLVWGMVVPDPNIYSIARWVGSAGWADKLAQVLGSTNPVAGPYYNFSVPEPTGVVAVVGSQE